MDLQKTGYVTGIGLRRLNVISNSEPIC